MSLEDCAPKFQRAYLERDGSEDRNGGAGACNPANQVAVAYRAYYAALVRYLESITGSRRDAEDAAQEAFGKLLALDHPVSVLEQYVWKTGANCARDIRRKRLVRNRLDPIALFDPIEAHPSPESWLDARQRLEIVEQAIDQLPYKCRFVFIRRLLEGCTFQDIATEMRLSERMVQEYHGRALEHCHRAIERVTEASGRGKR